MKKISRQDAMAQGLKRYFTGKPCKHGHVAERTVSKGTCVECMREHRKANREAKREYDRRYREANREKKKGYQREWYKANRKAVLRRVCERNKIHPELRREYNKANRDKRAAAQSKRRAAKIQRTPAWADIDAIARVYAQAKLAEAVTGWPHHVDHIIPLQGKNVSGLHIESNLRILFDDDNISKSNSWET